VNDNQIDDLLARAARPPDRVDPSLLKSVTGSLRSSLQPVRALAPAWVLAIEAVALASAVAIAGAARAGFFGFDKLSLIERALIFATLGALLWLAASEFVNQMIPGSRHRIGPRALIWTCMIALAAVFAILFRDYQTTHFVTAGMVCLAIGFVHAIPVGLLSWLVLRRGFAVDRVAAGFSAGLLGGLAGVTMLELHCPNFEALHVLVWHTAVVPASAAAGTLLAWLLRPASAAKTASAD
jgi:hypothetical protein